MESQEAFRDLLHSFHGSIILIFAKLDSFVDLLWERPLSLYCSGFEWVSNDVDDSVDESCAEAGCNFLAKSFRDLDTRKPNSHVLPRLQIYFTDAVDTAVFEETFRNIRANIPPGSIVQDRGYTETGGLGRHWQEASRDAIKRMRSIKAAKSEAT